jgi:winged helix DNA-binding protein
MTERITRRGRGRALLARQLLLARADLAVVEALEHLVAMQAQSPQAPYVGLWSRLAAFDPDELSRLLVGREVVRATTLRTTVHLSTRTDYLALRATVQPVLDRSFRSSPFRKALNGVDLDQVVAAGRKVLARTPLPRAALGPALAELFPGQDPESLGYAATWTEPVVQLPPRGVWRTGGQAVFAPASTWLGRRPGPPIAPDDLVLRYLAAYGPATVADVQVWSGLTGLRPAAEGLRDAGRLTLLVDDDGRELLDHPDAPRPSDDVPAPVRFVPEYDNLLLSHADRAHVIADEHRPRVFVRGAVLVDGLVAGAWRNVRRRGTTTLTLEPFRSWRPGETAEVESEGRALLRFVAPGEEHRLEMMSV